MVLAFEVLRGPEEIQEQLVVLRDGRHALCGASLGTEEYWKDLEAVYPVDVVILAKDDTVLVGFVLLREDYHCCIQGGCTTDVANNSFYIELVCSNVLGVGGKLMEYTKRFAREQHKSALHLSALFDLISYYASRHDFCLATNHNLEQVLELHVETLAVTRRRALLVVQKKQKSRGVAEIKAERKVLTARMRDLRDAKTRLVMCFRETCTYALKHPGTASSDDVLSEGVFMSFSLGEQ